MITQVKSSLPLTKQYTLCTAMIFCFTQFLQKPTIVSHYTNITFSLTTFVPQLQCPSEIFHRIYHLQHLNFLEKMRSVNARNATLNSFYWQDN